MRLSHIKLYVCYLLFVLFQPHCTKACTSRVIFLFHIFDLLFIESSADLFCLKCSQLSQTRTIQCSMYSINTCQSHVDLQNFLGFVQFLNSILHIIAFSMNISVGFNFDSYQLVIHQQTYVSCSLQLKIKLIESCCFGCSFYQDCSKQKNFLYLDVLSNILLFQ